MSGVRGARSAKSTPSAGSAPANGTPSSHHRPATTTTTTARKGSPKPQRGGAVTGGTGDASMAGWGRTLRVSGAGPGGGPRAPTSHDARRAIDAANGSSGGGTSHTAQLRQFEDFVKNFPVDRPSTAQSQQGHGTSIGPGSRSAPSGSYRESSHKGDSSSHHAGLMGSSQASIDLMRKAERDAQSKRATKEAAQRTLDMRKHKVDQWVRIADKNNERLRRENEALDRIAKLTQEAALDSDARYEDAVASLRAQVEYTSLYRSDNTASAAYVREAIASIQDRIRTIELTAERQKQVELQNIRTAFDHQVELRAEELEKERDAGKSTTAKWVEQNRELHAELESLLQRTDDAYHKHQTLTRKHQRLSIEHQAQSDDAVLLARQWTLVSSQHRRLQERVQELEAELAAMANADAPAFDSPSRSQQSPHDSEWQESNTPSKQHESDEQRGARLEVALRRAHQLLDSEAQSLNAVRHAHLDALRQRTELEVYLRQAVLHHQRHMSNLHYAQREGRKAASAGVRAGRHTASSMMKTHDDANGTTAGDGAVAYAAFTADDRRLVVEALLQVPRVLQLLYSAGGHDTATDEAKRDRREKRRVLRDDLASLGVALNPRDVAAVDNADDAADDPAMDGELASSVDGLTTAAASAAVTQRSGLGGSNALRGSTSSGAGGVKAQEQALEALWERWTQWTEAAADAVGEQHTRATHQGASFATTAMQ